MYQMKLSLYPEDSVIELQYDPFEGAGIEVFTGEPGADLKSAAYLTVEDAKNLREALDVLITTIERKQS